MPVQTTNYDHTSITFFLDNGDPLSASLMALTTESSEANGTLKWLELTLAVSPSDYADIDEKAIFHLTPDVRGPGSERVFRADAPIEIEVRLDPAVLPGLADQVKTSDAIGAYLLAPQNDDTRRFLRTDHWYALHVKQEEQLPPELQAPGRSLKAGYSTTWIETLTRDDSPSTSLLTLMETLSEDGWNWARGVDSFTLMTRYWTDDSEQRWTIYSQIREEEHFCLVYSLCPIQASMEQLPQVREFISRANWDLPIGNFEVNDDTLEVRFKTSLDYEGTDLTHPLVRQLLRANVAMMERYLPGLRELLERGASVIDALNRVEG